VVQPATFYLPKDKGRKGLWSGYVRSDTYLTYVSLKTLG